MVWVEVEGWSVVGGGWRMAVKQMGGRAERVGAGDGEVSGWGGVGIVGVWGRGEGGMGRGGGGSGWSGGGGWGWEWGCSLHWPSL